ncbi:hypothetical protein CMUS01_12954 [Colletotrichum musicola]|uniref:Ecp2 effector protein domain-containing protein n=1 Tax=Colletotrichum musicola TaxID=2175873 RepID=A0A8H6MXS8_9PEZI|nr:hypothetical protein CMUS01_12954 [Colletotrichum musicola]
MVNFIRAASLLALVPSISAAPTTAEALEVRAETEVFSFEKWAEDIIANPGGNHLSPDEAVALAFNQTSTDEHTIQKRASCNIVAGSPASAADAVWCIDFIAARANVKCEAAVSGTSFCRRGLAQITGVSGGFNPPRSTSTLCGNVARSAGAIMDQCTRNGQVYGTTAAWGNGNLAVHIRHP